jgi:hypothetical protein
MKKNRITRFHFLIFLLSCLSQNAIAQNGKIEGKITDAKTNVAIPGVSIAVDTDSRGAITDVDGHFMITASPGNHILTITSIGYKTKEISDVVIIAGKITNQNIILETAIKTEEEIVIKTTPRRETTAALISYQKNTSAVASVISAESIKRSPDKNTGEALKRVPGLSIQEGRYLVVRGLSDRYNQAMLNGVLLSSTEPDRKTFSFDIFPSAVIENIIINKTFIPEYSGEWAGGLVQVNTRDIPSNNFLNIQAGTNFNTQTTGRDFYTSKGGKLDWLGLDNGTRALPGNFPNENNFAALPDAGKIEWGKKIAAGKWGIDNHIGPLNALGQHFQASGGVTSSIFKKEAGGVFTVTYNRGIKALDYQNSFFSFSNDKASRSFNYDNTRYSRDVLWGAMANFSVKLNPDNIISLKNLFNVHSFNNVSLRSGKDYEANSQLGENIRARELNFTSNTFFNTILSGEHQLKSFQSKIKWYGSFNILDQSVPFQRRLQYNQDPGAANAPYLALIASSLSQKSGSIFYSDLSDYIYSAGGDITTTYKLFSSRQTIKAGYMLQVKDRLFDAQPFSVNLPSDNERLKALDEDEIFAPGNFGTADNLLHFDALFGDQYKYFARSILNAGYLQFDNVFNKWLRIVWGARYENFDHLAGKTKSSGSYFVNSIKGDLLPALNVTFKVDPKTNIRLAGSQTLVRPEFRELSNFAFYDFEVGATFMGDNTLNRTKITNFDLRYEVYPRAGEMITAGVFFKHFDQPIELLLNQTGAGSSSTFNYVNASSAKSFGVEFEFRKKLDFISNNFKNFTLQGNFSYIYNRVKFENNNLDRPMQGQSPYLINAGLLYDAVKPGITVTVLFNEIGRRILYVGSDEVPVIWEAPRPLLDFQFTKKIIKNKGELKLNIADIINRKANFYYDLNNNNKYDLKDALALTRDYGTNVSITFSYTIK